MLCPTRGQAEKEKKIQRSQNINSQQEKKSTAPVGSACPHELAKAQLQPCTFGLSSFARTLASTLLMLVGRISSVGRLYPSGIFHPSILAVSELETSVSIHFALFRITTVHPEKKKKKRDFAQTLRPFAISVLFLARVLRCHSLSRRALLSCRP